MVNKAYLINPLDKGFQVDTTNDEGKAIHTGHTSSKNAWNYIKNKIPANHQVLITDMGEINNGKS